MGYQRPTTPFLDGLAGESFVFPTAIAAGVPTYYSFPAILASRYPLALGREILGLAPEEKNLASALKEEGYATAFFGAANPYLSARFGYDFGFDAFRDFLDGDLTPLSDPDHASLKGAGWAGNLNRSLERVSHKIPGMGAVYDELYFQYCQRWAAPAPKTFDTLRRFPSADVIVEQARTWLASVGENPFFLWLHFMDPHSPYYPTERGLAILGETRLTASRARYLNAYWNRFDIGSKRLRSYRDEVIALYDAGICWVDAQISRLVEVLRQHDLWENCVFALTADHGEEFLEHGRYHAPALTEKLIHVPLVFRAPGATKRIVSSNPFSLVHLAPTLLAAADVPIPREFQGQSQWNPIQEGRAWSEPAISECIAGCTNPFVPDQRRGTRLLAIREAQYKMVVNFAAGTEYLFDIKADPGEQTPLAGAAGKPARRRLLEAALFHLRRIGSQQKSEVYLRARLRAIALGLTDAVAIGAARALGEANPRRDA
jgi:arylsulfatase A-like enzyme